MPAIAAFLGGGWFAVAFVMATSSADEPSTVAFAMAALVGLLVLATLALAGAAAVVRIADWMGPRCPNG